MKTKVIFTMLIQQLAFALIATFFCFTLGFSIYSIFKFIGFKMAEVPMWMIRLNLIFLQIYLSFVTLVIWTFKKNKMKYEDYCLTIEFKKDFTNRDKCMTLLKRQLFHVESESELEINAFRTVGKILKRKQLLNIRFEKDLATFDVRLEKTIYPVDYFLNNHHVKLSFLNNL